MAVLVEAISVIVRRDAITSRFPGGWSAFVDIVPNETLCADGELARIGFMSPGDVESFIRRLERWGLVFLQDGNAQDISVVDQMRGPTMPTEWLQFAHLPFGEGEAKVAACWLFEGQRLAAGLHFRGKEMSLATPQGWRYEDSLSANFKFVKDEESKERLRFLRHEEGMDVYLDVASGKEVYLARSESD
jgi:hypothetical protein